MMIHTNNTVAFIESTLNDMTLECTQAHEFINGEVLPIFNEMQQHVSIMQQKLSANDHKMKQYEELIQKQHGLIGQLQRKLATFTSSNDETEETKTIVVDGINSEINSLKRELKLAKSQLAAEQNSRQRERIQMSQNMKDQESIVNKLKAEYTSSDRKCKQLEKDIADVVQKHVNEEKNNVKLQDQIQKLTLNHRKEQDKLIIDHKNELISLERLHNDQIQNIQRNSKKESERIQIQRNKLEEQVKQDTKIINILKKQLADMEYGIQLDSVRKTKSLRRTNSGPRLNSSSNSVASILLTSPRDRSISLAVTRRELTINSRVE
jgi:DNA repair exonuclease SbcCD ATPase subunit